MTQRELVAVLVEECQAPPIKIEDFLNALHDVVIETLARGQALRLGKTGVFRIRMHGDKPALNFYASEATRERLKLEGAMNRAPTAEACPECVKRANKTQRQRRWKAKRRKR